jgi:hypothetical protein
MCVPKSWDHTVREEEKRMQRRHDYNKHKCKHKEAFQSYLNGTWPNLSELDVLTDWTPEGSVQVTCPAD